MNAKGSYPDPKKVVVERFLIPKSITNVKAFLGLTRYYIRFIPRYAKIVEPLFGMTKKDCKFVWTPIYQGAFVTLKKGSWNLMFRLDLIFHNLSFWMWSGPSKV